MIILAAVLHVTLHVVVRIVDALTVSSSQQCNRVQDKHKDHGTNQSRTPSSAPRRTRRWRIESSEISQNIRLPVSILEKYETGTLTVTSVGRSRRAIASCTCCHRCRSHQPVARVRSTVVCCSPVHRTRCSAPNGRCSRRRRPYSVCRLCRSQR